MKSVKSHAKPLKVLDTSALIAYLEGESSGALLTDLFKEALAKESPLLFSVINWGEVLYLTARRFGAEKAEMIERLISQLPVKILDLDQDLTRRAALLRSEFRLPYADCFPAALAEKFHAELLTKDQDFRLVEKRIAIRWL